MSSEYRGTIHILTFVLGVVLILAMALGIVWFVRRELTNASASGEAVDLTSLEKTLLGLYLSFHQQEIETPVSSDATPVEFTIQPGESVTSIAERLESKGLIKDAQLFRLALRYWGVDAQIEAGDYRLRPNMTMAEMAAELQHGRLRSKVVTIKEGLRAEEVAHLLASEGLVSQEEFITLVRQGQFDYDFLARPADAPDGLEGFLFPDTYEFPANASARDIIETMLRNFDRRFTLQMRQQALDRNMSIYQVITLASIVEREAVLDEERPIIASIYFNRLKAGMYLQADPTVQYAKGFDEKTGRWWAPMLQEEANTIESPYNTFLHPGLPPGPICSPGLAAIQAVLQPADTDYLFFFSKGDGSHAFASTYEEHLENWRKYQQ
ncbi:MAG: endolytic transglycosylase MltG [Chloroflexi bacterium]|nr:endolytic transglycosylase MltG [Chloroflexota bacterium]